MNSTNRYPTKFIFSDSEMEAAWSAASDSYKRGERVAVDRNVAELRAKLADIRKWREHDRRISIAREWAE